MKQERRNIAKVATEHICQIVWTVWLFFVYIKLFMLILGGYEGKMWKVLEMKYLRIT
ncbi:MAG: hypothetical protein P4L35_13035 [Ignavibacteriaceae bacterium]|nr:hypothetical protein [Ignavibacteriaceae bacterium]